MIRDATTAPLPTPPAGIAEPLSIGGLTMPSRFFLAPMAGYTGLAFRLAVRREGGLGLATSDLVNARSLLENRRRALELVATAPDDRPVAIQLYGHVVSEMCDAARRVVDLGASIVDINMGCPVRKVVRSGGGSALLCDATAATRLVAAVVEAVPVPVSVKMRLGWDDENVSAPALARAFEQVGAAAVTIHGRTREQGFSGTVRLDGIRAVVEAVERIPIVGNGDVRTIADADAMFRQTGCSAISLGRGALGNPFIFRQLDRWSRLGHPGPPATFEERLALMERHFRRLVATVGERIACLQFRKMTRSYQQLTRMPRSIYLRLINLPNAARFDEVLAELRRCGPTGPLPEHLPAAVAVPAGPNEHW